MASFNPSQVGYKHLRGRRPRWESCLFQSLTGRLQTMLSSRSNARVSCFNPSQVGYKHKEVYEDEEQNRCFNPSQVGYKLKKRMNPYSVINSFNPSQVGYKPIRRGAPHSLGAGFNPSQVGYKLRHSFTLARERMAFQSLTGRLQTGG